MIYGDRVRLRAVAQEDLPIFMRWLNDPEVIEGLNLYRPISLKEEEGWYERVLDTPLDERPLVIEVKEGNEWIPIGTMGFNDIKWRERSAEFGIMIGEKNYWDKGYGSEATRMMLDHAFASLNLNRVYLRVFETNQRAIHAYKKIGFVTEGQLREADYREGKYLDVLIMSVLKKEWEVPE